jgi:hypothetical protein
MDLPSCPACGQSVLDEDAEDCPFCGASMSGKPGAKSPAGSTGAATDKQAGTKKRKAAAPQGEKPESDDPFDVAAPVSRKVVQLLAKPTKGKLDRVICPMCDTAGFQSKKAAGREVRCANKECLVPIFTAPAPEGEEKPDAAARAEALAAESQSNGLSIGAYSGIAVVAAVVLGGGAFYFTSEPEVQEKTFEELMAEKRGGNPAPAPVSPDNPGTTPHVEPDEPVVDPGPTGPPVVEMRSTSLRIMAHTSLQNDRNQRKPFCRRLTAEAFAIAGDFDGVTEQLTQLKKVGPQLTYYRILPLVQVAWSHLQAGNSDAATAAVAEALPLVDDLPAFGTLAIDTVTDLAAVLVALNRTPEAIKLLEERSDTGPVGQFLESRSRSESSASHSFDLAVSLRPVTGWSAPQCVAVTVQLTARGMPDQALAFAKQAPDQSAIEDCLSSWAEASLLAAGDDKPLSSIDTAIASLDKNVQAKIQSRCSLTLFGMGKPALAAAPLAKARTLLGTAGAPFSITVQRLKQNPRLTLPAELPIRRKVLAAAELAHVEAVLGEDDAAWKSVLLAMDFTRTMAPTLKLANQPGAEIKQRGEAAVTDELKTLKNLLTADEARIAYRNYRNRSLKVLNAATARFDLQEQILTEVLQWGFTDRIWEEVQKRAGESTEADSQEPWFETNLVKAIYNDFRVRDHVDKALAVEAAVTKSRLDGLSAPHVVALFQSAERAMGSNSSAGARLLASFLRKYNEEADKQWQQETMLRLVSRLVAADRNKDAFKLVAAIQDVQTRELAYELAGMEIAARGHLVAVYDYARNTDIVPPEKVALLRGFIGQLPAK